MLTTLEAYFLTDILKNFNDIVLLDYFSSNAKEDKINFYDDTGNITISILVEKTKIDYYIKGLITVLKDLLKSEKYKKTLFINRCSILKEVLEVNLRFLSDIDWNEIYEKLTKEIKEQENGLSGLVVFGIN